LRREDLQGVSLDQLEAGLVFKILLEKGDQALVDFQGLDGVAGAEQGAG